MKVPVFSYYTAQGRRVSEVTRLVGLLTSADSRSLPSVVSLKPCIYIFD